MDQQLGYEERDALEKTLYVLDYIVDFLAVRNAYPYLTKMYNERLLDSGMYDRLRALLAHAGEEGQP